VFTVAVGCSFDLEPCRAIAAAVAKKKGLRAALFDDMFTRRLDEYLHPALSLLAEALMQVGDTLTWLDLRCGHVCARTADMHVLVAVTGCIVSFMGTLSATCTSPLTTLLCLCSDNAVNPTGAKNIGPLIRS